MVVLMVIPFVLRYAVVFREEFFCERVVLHNNWTVFGQSLS